MSQLPRRGVGAPQGVSGVSLEVCKQGRAEHCCGCGSRKSGSDWKTSPLSLSHSSRNLQTDSSASIGGAGGSSGWQSSWATPEEDTEAREPREW